MGSTLLEHGHRGFSADRGLAGRSGVTYKYNSVKAFLQQGVQYQLLSTHWFSTLQILLHALFLPAPCDNVCQLSCRLCAVLFMRLGRGVSSSSKKPDLGALLAQLMTRVHFPLYTTFLVAMHSVTDFTTVAHTLGLRYQDIEWFSRAAMLKVILQTCTKQGAMPAAVLAEARRHAARLVELMPDNPGSYEIMSYVLMHDAEQSLEDARSHMEVALLTAEDQDNDVGVMQYALQVMYFLLWGFIHTSDRAAELASMQHHVLALLSMATQADGRRSLSEEAFGRLQIEMVDPVPEFCWERQNLQLVAAKTKLGALAWQIAETPRRLLDYLAPYIPDSPSRFSSTRPPKTPTSPPLGTQPDHTLRSLPFSRQLPLLSKSLRPSKLSRQSMHSPLQRRAAGQISSRADVTAHTGSAVTTPISNRVTSSRTSGDTAAAAKDTGHSPNATSMSAEIRPLSNEGLSSQDASRQHDMQQPSRSASMGLSSRLDTDVPSFQTSKLNNGKQVCQSGAQFAWY